MVKTNTIKLNTKPIGAKSVRKAKKNKQTKLRKSLTPGTIVIALTGQFRGKRMVMLKQLEKSGMLLVTGPYKINGVPLRRMNARYVIATSTKVDVSKVDCSKIDDSFFSRSGEKKSKSFGEKEEKKQGPSAERSAAQKKIDAAISIKDATMKKYLSAKFALSNSDMAHELKF